MRNFTKAQIALLFVLAAGCGSSKPQPAEPQKAPEDAPTAENDRVPTSGAPAAQNPGPAAEANAVPSGSAPGSPKAKEDAEVAIVSASTVVPTAGALENYITQTSSDVFKEVSANLGQVKPCYLRTLAEHPGLTGKVVVKFSVARNGKVTAAEPVETTLPDEVAACVVKKLKGMKFPKQKTGPVSYEYPFEFRPNAE